jgi:hypothetical protein
MEIQDLDDINSDSDIENPTEYNEILDNLTLEYYPDPFNTIGQFIMTAISGAAISHLVRLKENKPISYRTDINIYFQYCKKSPDDNYINELVSRLNLDINEIEDSQRLNMILDQINNISINIMDNFVELHVDLFNKHKSKSEEDFNMDLFNADILKNLIPMIKYSLISNIKTK